MAFGRGSCRRHELPQLGLPERHLTGRPARTSVQRPVEVGCKRVDVEVPRRVARGGGRSPSDLLARPDDLSQRGGEQSPGRRCRRPSRRPTRARCGRPLSAGSTEATTGSPYIMKFMSFEGMLNSSPPCFWLTSAIVASVQLVLQAVARDEARPSRPGRCGSPRAASGAATPLPVITSRTSGLSSGSASKARTISVRPCEKPMLPMLSSSVPVGRCPFVPLACGTRVAGS